MEQEMEQEKYEKEFQYLERLRKSGVTNMFGAGVYLENEFGYDRAISRNILLEWMRRYDELSKKYKWR